jgi:hypothetical protein
MIQRLDFRTELAQLRHSVSFLPPPFRRLAPVRRVVQRSGAVSRRRAVCDGHVGMCCWLLCTISLRAPREWWNTCLLHTATGCCSPVSCSIPQAHAKVGKQCKHSYSCHAADLHRPSCGSSWSSAASNQPDVCPSPKSQKVGGFAFSLSSLTNCVAVGLLVPVCRPRNSSLQRRGSV